MGNGLPYRPTKLCEKFSSLSFDSLRRILESEIHIRYYQELNADQTIKWSGYCVAWVHDDCFIRLTPYFSSFVEAYEAKKHSCFISDPKVRVDRSYYGLVKGQKPRQKIKRSAVRLLPIPDKATGFQGRDLRNQRFGLLVAQAVGGRLSSGHWVWNCACDCGTRIQVRITDLTTGRKSSCGCDKITKPPAQVQPAMEMRA